MNGLADLLRSALASGRLVALPLALLGGMVASMNPCCLPLYPAAAAACCATRRDHDERSLRTALAFVVGVAVATAMLGVIAAAAGRTLSGLGGWWGYLVAVIPLLMGIHLLGWFRLPMPTFGRVEGRGGIGGAFITGLLLSLVLAPCGTPLLASVLSYAALTGSLTYGAVLLFLYGLGAGAPVLLIGTTAGRLAARLDASGRRVLVDRLTGVGLLALGFYLLWTQ